MGDSLQNTVLDITVCACVCICVCVCVCVCVCACARAHACIAADYFTAVTTSLPPVSTLPCHNNLLQQSPLLPLFLLYHLSSSVSASLITLLLWYPLQYFPWPSHLFHSLCVSKPYSNFCTSPIMSLSISIISLIISFYILSNLVLLQLLHR
jgi:hypothetical protein